MPELPEVETIKIGLTKYLPGKKIAAVKVLRPASVAYPKSGKKFEQALQGQEFADTKRRGKYLLIGFRSKAQLVVHLKMSGRLLFVSKKNKPDKHVRVYFDLDNNKQLVFEDMRVFGRLWFIPSEAELITIIPALGELGPEPLDNLDVKSVFAKIKRRRQAIKTTLLDQRIIAGIGNIYADEALHLAGINPNTSCCDLNSKQINVLSEKIKKVLSNAIKLGGSTLRNYTNSEGVNGNYQNDSLVYGRTGKPCRTCKTSIVKIRLGGRSAHFCPKCQK